MNIFLLAVTSFTYLTKSWAVPGTWQTKHICISFVSFEIELTGVEVRLELGFVGLCIWDVRRVRTGGVAADLLTLFGSFCGVFNGEDTVDGGDFGD